MTECRAIRRRANDSSVACSLPYFAREQSHSRSDTRRVRGASPDFSDSGRRTLPPFPPPPALFPDDGNYRSRESGPRHGGERSPVGRGRLIRRRLRRAEDAPVGRALGIRSGTALAAFAVPSPVIPSLITMPVPSRNTRSCDSTEDREGDNSGAARESREPQGFLPPLPPPSLVIPERDSTGGRVIVNAKRLEAEEIRDGGTRRP